MARRPQTFATRVQGMPKFMAASYASRILGADAEKLFTRLKKHFPTVKADKAVKGQVVKGERVGSEVYKIKINNAMSQTAFINLEDAKTAAKSMAALMPKQTRVSVVSESTMQPLADFTRNPSSPHAKASGDKPSKNRTRVKSAVRTALNDPRSSMYGDTKRILKSMISNPKIRYSKGLAEGHRKTARTQTLLESGYRYDTNFIGRSGRRYGGVTTFTQNEARKSIKDMLPRLEQSWPNDLPFTVDIRRLG